MGAEATCDAVVNGQRRRGKAKLETSTLEFRDGAVRVVMPFKDVTRVTAEAGVLTVESATDKATLSLGPTAARWADKIRNPPSRLQKFGAKPSWRVSVIGDSDAEFVASLRAVVAHCSVMRALKNSDAIVLFVSRAAELARISTLTQSLKPDGALWVVRPKGHAEISEQAVRRAGKAAGLVDVKVAAFSATHTAEKFVIPKQMRARA